MSSLKSINVFLLLIVVIFIAGCSSRTTTYHRYDPTPTPPSTSSKVINTPQMHRATMRPYIVHGKKYYPTKVSVGDSFSGVASWYGKKFHGKKTSNGEYYNMYDLTAAHKTLPMNTMVKVTNLNNNRELVLRVNDRGPFVKSRIIDLSYTAAHRLGVVKNGTAPVHLEILGFSGVITTASQGQTSVEGGGFLVQIGAFRRLEGAKTYQARYNNTDNRYTTVIQSGTLDGSTIHRVYLKGFASEAEARDFIATGQFGGAFIIRDSE